MMFTQGMASWDWEVVNVASLFSHIDDEPRKPWDVAILPSCTPEGHSCTDFLVRTAPLIWYKSAQPRFRRLRQLKIVISASVYAWSAVSEDVGIASGTWRDVLTQIRITRIIFAAHQSWTAHSSGSWRRKYPQNRWRPAAAEFEVQLRSSNPFVLVSWEGCQAKHFHLLIHDPTYNKVRAHAYFPT